MLPANGRRESPGVPAGTKGANRTAGRVGAIPPQVGHLSAGRHPGYLVHDSCLPERAVTVATIFSELGARRPSNS